MSDSSHNELSDFSDVEDSKQSVETQAAEPPRIKLKLRLNPAVPPSDDKKKKHKDKKKKSHKKRKRLKEIDDDESAINDSARRDSELVDIGDDSVQHDVAIPVPTNSSTAHVPVGGKRPFAFIKDEENSQDEDQPSSFTDQQRIGGGPTNMDDDQDEDDEDTYSYTTERQYSISSQPVHPMEPMVTEESSKTQQKAKKRGRPSKSKAQPKAEPRASEQPKRDLKSVCAKLLDNLEKRDAYGFFLQPVDTTIVRDYLTVIKQPMDFSKMRKKLANNQYQTMDDFRNDFMLIVKNAKTYNAPDTIYYKSADRLEHTGLKAIEKAEKTVVYDSPGPNDDNESTYSRSNSWAMRRLSTYSGKNVKVEEEVDIMGLDNTVPLAPAFRHDSESALADSSRATTPTRQLAKKKKKKVTDAGVAYASDGSLSAIGSIDLYNLIPPDRPFASLPDITIANMNALPSAFYNNRSAYSTDDWSANKHFVRPAMYTDYAAMIATGEDPPGAFYTAQDACYIYPLYGDDRGEAYMRSLWEFLGDVNMEQVAESKANYLTKGAWDVLKQVLAKSDENLKPSFGNVNIAKVIQDMKSGAAQQ